MSQKIGEGQSEDKSLLRILKEGDYFGERALLHDEQRSATVTAASKVKLLRLDKTVFTTLLGYPLWNPRTQKQLERLLSPLLALSPLLSSRSPVVGSSSHSGVARSTRS